MTTTATASNNVHRLSVVDPSEYVHVAEFYQGPSEEMQHAFQAEHEALEAAGVDWFAGFGSDEGHYRVTDRHVKVGNVEFHRNGGCAHCGSHFSYGSIFKHEVHGFVALGHTCAGERFQFDSKVEMRAAMARKAGDAARKRAKTTAKFMAQVAEIDGLAEALECEHYIIANINLNGKKYGSISEKQAALVLKIAAEEVERAAERKVKEEAAELVKLVPVPEFKGRTTVEGEVVFTKWYDSDFGGSLKMVVVVRTDEGEYSLFGSVPSALESEVAFDEDGRHFYTECVGKGDVVRFDARVEPGREESKGRFSRPTKAVFVKRAEEVAE